MARKSGNIFKGEVNEQATSSATYPRKNYKVEWEDGKPIIIKENKRKRKIDKFSMKKQLERQHQPIPHSLEEWGGHRGLIEYQMGKAMAEDILDLRKGKEKGIDPQKWLCDYVNDQMGLIGYCIKVVVVG